MRIWHYCYHGIRVASELPFPEWDLFAELAPAGDAEVRISIESEPSGTVSDAALASAGNLAVVQDGEFALRIPETGDLRVRDGRSIVITPLPQVDLGAFRPWVLGSAWAALCYQRGLLVIHASAVRTGNEAVAFCGRTGQGKSATAAHLLSVGYPLVSDDLCRIHAPSGERPLIYPSTPRIKLWNESLAELGWRPEEGVADGSRAGKFHFPLSADTRSKPLPAKAVYLLEWGELRIRELSGANALSRFLRAATYRGRVLNLLGEAGHYSQLCAEFVNRVPVFEFRRPQGVSALADNVAFIGEHISLF